MPTEAPAENPEGARFGRRPSSGFSSSQRDTGVSSPAATPVLGSSRGPPSPIWTIVAGVRVMKPVMWSNPRRNGPA